MRRKKSGNVRMAELGRVKVEVWFTPEQAAQLQRIAHELNIGKATYVRRAANYMVRGGVGTSSVLRNGYD